MRGTRERGERARGVREGRESEECERVRGDRERV